MYKVVATDCKGRVRKTKLYETKERFDKWFPKHIKLLSCYTVKGYQLEACERSGTRWVEVNAPEKD